MSSVDSLAKDLYNIINTKNEKGPRPYDSIAEVVKVDESDDSIIWVRLPGSDGETPIEKTVNAKEGDSVRVRLSGGRAWVLGNASSPPTDDTRANEANDKAIRAIDIGEQALAEADRAKLAADKAEAEAVRAGEAANRAETEAVRAGEAADEAKDEAERATGYANNALAGLGTLESVIDTVDWFATHKTASTDTTVDPDKTYYIYNSSTGTLSKVVPEGTENPSQEGWYELDEAITNYVASHIAQTDDGLYVVGLANGWKVLVSSGSGHYTPGVYIIDPTGGIAQATTASGITFDDNKPFYIGDNDASIVFDGNGHISINGHGIRVGGNKPLDDVLAELGASIKKVEYGVGSSPTSHSDVTNWSTNTPTWTVGSYIWMRTTTNGLTYTYTCIQGAKGETGSAGADGEDAVLVNIHSSNGMAFKNDSVNTTLTVTIYYGSVTITNQTGLVNAFGLGSYLQWKARLYGESSYTTIPSNDPRLSNNGFTFVLTPADVNVQAVFNVEIIVPD